MKKAIMLGIILMSFMLLMPCFAQTPPTPDPPVESTWVNIVGFVDSDFPPPTGFLKANAKVDEWAKVHAFWNKTPGDSTYSFYAAVLVDASTIESHYINGTWNVYNVTFEYQELDIEEYNSIIEILLEGVEGELIIDPDRTFELAITGIDPVVGNVLVHIVVPVAIPMGDTNMDRTVNILDIIQVAVAFDTTPGRAGYDFNLDLNFDFHINIIDLVTAARDYGKGY